ncbi:MAG: inosine/xanthosine triphosphatase [Bacteroidota bacterium]
MPHLIVASQNPVKKAAALQGFQELFRDQTFTVEGLSVPSGVSDQPLGDTETYQGAWNRVQAAKAQYPAADYWVGIEGGNIRGPHGMEVMAWVVVQSATAVGKARTAGFMLPSKVVKLIDEGYELGHAMDAVYQTNNSKHSGGASGLLTDGVIDRLRFYVPAVILALLPFYQTNLYLNEKE